jgi:hypothetical protein
MTILWKRAVLAAAAAIVAAPIVAVSPAAAAPLRDIPAPAGSVVAVNVGTPNSLVFGNLIVVAARGNGYVTAWPCNQPRPTMSVANYSTGTTRATGVAVRADSNGDVCFYTSGATHIVFEQQGVTASGVGNLVSPARVLDTRISGGKYYPGKNLAVPTGAPGGSVVLTTITAASPDTSGWVVAYTCGTPQPASSHLTFASRVTTANTVAVQADANGNICLYASTGTHLIVDRAAATNYLLPAAVRVLDSRSTGILPAGGVITIRTGNPGSVLLSNITVVNPSVPGYVTAYPCAQGRGGTSTVNFPVARQNISNFAAVPTDQNGDLCLYSTSQTHLLLDAEAASTKERNTIPAATPVRKVDTRALDVPLHPGTGKPFPALVSRWFPNVVSQLEARGLPATYSPGVLAQIQQESSGIPDAVNDWDSNWKNGIASFGLLQTIYPTFNTYAAPECQGPNTPKLVKGVLQQYTPTMVDPSCNIGAGISYAKARYGVGKFDLWNTGNNPAY